jgi:hypothetical protein
MQIYVPPIVKVDLANASIRAIDAYARDLRELNDLITRLIYEKSGHKGFMNVFLSESGSPIVTPLYGVKRPRRFNSL